MKVVINRCCGFFRLSKKAYKFLGRKWDGIGYGRFPDVDYSLDSESRGDPELVKCVETLGDKANGCDAKLKVVEIPDDVEWYVYFDDIGFEEVHEKHRVWK